MSCQGTTRLADLVILLRLQQHENRAASQPHSKGVKPISDRIVATIFTVPRQRSRFDNAGFSVHERLAPEFWPSHATRCPICCPLTLPIEPVEPDGDDLIHL